MKFGEKIVNAIYGQCVADAVGNPFEFETNINQDDVIRYANDSDLLVISDDSQMGPLFGLEAIKNLDLYAGDIYHKVESSFTQSYLDWYFTQTHSKNDYLPDSDSLLKFKSVFSVQSPGQTCLSALETLQKGKKVKNNSKGCGSVMRLLPLVTLFDDKHSLEYSEVIECAKITGDITHKHLENADAIHLYMAVAKSIISGKSFTPTYETTKHISELGEGWTALEAVKMAVWAYCNAESFDDLLKLSIAHDGDSDSLGAIAGSLWGLSGREVPEKYIKKLDSLDAIEYVLEIVKDAD